MTTATKRTHQHRKACAHLRSVDPTMDCIIGRIGEEARLKVRDEEPFQSLVRAVINQQLSGKAAATILGRFKLLYPKSEFPSPKEVIRTNLDKLRSVGLSRPKAGYIKDIARKVILGVVPASAECDTLTDVDIINRLTQIKGIGRWTAEMFLMFNLGRPDVLPVHDLGVRKGFQIAFKKRQLPEPEQLDRYGERWKPYRSTAALYLWRTVDFLADGK
ncbi:MAG: DNA-3-methyladenine glycosylase [Verrucomicrobia bacterium]|nr:DNA-3-methyladenine glycosylase [Verrucomicrobiota bacterium]